MSREKLQKRSKWRLSQQDRASGINIMRQHLRLQASNFTSKTDTEIYVETWLLTQDKSFPLSTPGIFPEGCPATILPRRLLPHTSPSSKAEESQSLDQGLDLSGVQRTGKWPGWHYSEDSTGTMSADSSPIKWQFCLKAVFLATPSSAHCCICAV